MDAPVSTIATLRIEELIAHISSDHVAPGAGAAGAVVLALAAACACKAVSVTLKHRPDDVELQSAFASFTKIARLALSDADRDAEAFQEFIRHKDPVAIDRLVCEGENVAHLIAAVATAIKAVELKIRPNMTGDLIAARALVSAAHRIQARNEAEALEGR